MNDIDLSNLIVERLYALNRINILPGQKVHREARERDAIAIKTSGKTLYTAQGIEYLSDPSHIVLLPRGSSYSWICNESGECLMIEFDALPLLGLKGLRSFKMNTKELITIFNRIEYLWTFKKPAYTLKCMAGLYEILAKLSEAGMTNYQLSSKFDLIKPSVEFLETHYNDYDLSNETLSQVSGISTVYFRKIFFEIYHSAPMKYVQTIRIEKAKDLLLSGDYLVGDVAAAVGFSNIYHFSKTFKKMTGCSPNEYSKNK